MLQLGEKDIMEVPHDRMKVVMLVRSDWGLHNLGRGEPTVSSTNPEKDYRRLGDLVS